MTEIIRNYGKKLLSKKKIFWLQLFEKLKSVDLLLIVDYVVSMVKKHKIRNASDIDSQKLKILLK